MDDKDPTSVIKMIKDLRSASESYRRSSGAPLPLRLSGTAYMSFGDHDVSTVTPKKPRLDDSANATLNKSETESAPGSPWEWRRLRGEVTIAVPRIVKILGRGNIIIFLIQQIPKSQDLL